MSNIYGIIDRLSRFGRLADISQPQLRQELAELEAGSRMAVEDPLQHRLRSVFPAGFDRPPPTSGERKSFTPEDLYETLIDGRRSNDRVESIYLVSATYRKRTAPPEHEFILIEVEDRKLPGLRNYMILDRVPGPAETVLATSGGQYHSSLATDRFRVAYDGDESKLIAQCNLKTHRILETMIFQNNDPLPFHCLVGLARTVSKQREHYNVLNSNCYWFAGLTWECLLFMRPGAGYNSPLRSHRGKFGGWKGHATEWEEIVACIKDASALAELDFGIPTVDTLPQTRAQTQKMRRNLKGWETIPRVLLSLSAAMTAYGLRDRSTFPTEFDSGNPNSQSQPPNCLTLSEMYDILIEGSDRNRPAISIVVKSVSYGKLKQGHQHEFILIEVGYQDAAGLTEYLLLDCDVTGGAHNYLPRVFRQGTSRSQLSVPWSSNRDWLLAMCDLNPHNIVEDIRFSSETPFFFYHLVALVYEVSSARVNYRFGSVDIYWFTGLIWDLVLKMHPEANHRHYEARNGLRRGELQGLRVYTTNTNKLNVLSERTRSRFDETKLTIARREEVSSSLVPRLGPIRM